MGITLALIRMLTALLTLVFCGLISTTQISCCSVSLEGKQFWILKSCPINIKKLLLAKSLLQFSIIEPFIIICSSILSIFLRIGFVNFIILLAIPTLLNLISSFGGVLINIYNPKLDFDDETKVIKQSISVLLSMVFTFVLTLIPLVIYLIFPALSINFIIVITLTLFTVVLITIIILLFTNGVKKFNTLQN